jgi:PAS domain S-box-containing protein
MADSSARTAPRTTVVVAEDDRGLCRLILRALGREGFDARGATTGAEAAALCGEIDGPALLLLDYQLPDMNALQLVRQLRDVGQTHPFVIMTGHGDERVAVELMKLGAWDYLIKDDGFLDFLPLTVRRATERLRREHELVEARRVVAERERYYRGLLQQLQDGLAVVGSDCRVVDANQRFEALLGCDPGELMGSHCSRVSATFGADCDPERSCTVQSVLASDAPLQGLYRTQRNGEDPRWSDVVFSPLRDLDGTPHQVVVAVRDVTELKALSDEQRLVIEISELLNRATDRSEAMRGLLERLQVWCGCEAVAVRLVLGEDVPYYETRGFSAEFVEAERSLCAHAADGSPLRDERGQPVLACMCGNVLQGRTEPSKPCFTSGGSFVTNGTTALLASSTEEELGGPTRNTCNAHGYESVALIPLRHGERTLGLLQFNDSRPGRFTPRRIRVLESVAQHVALAVAQYIGREDLAHSEELFRLIFETSRDAIVWADADSGTMLRCNRAAEALFERSRDWIVGRHVAELRPPAERTIFAERWSQFITTARPLVFEGVLEPSPHRRVPVRVTATVTTIDDRSVVQMVFQDMSELRRLEIELRHAQKMDSLGRLSSGIAHEINTPLQYLGDSLHFVQTAYQHSLERGAFDHVYEAVADHEENTDPMIQRSRVGEGVFDPEFLREEIPRAFDRAQQGLERVRSIVHSMRKLSHPSGVKPAPADLNQLVRDALVVSRNEYKYIATVETDLGELPPVRCYASDLGQVLLNLIVNAAQALRQASGRGSALGTIQIRTRRNASMVELRVSDSGPGVPESLRSRLFEPFFTTKAPGKGTGQGLAIAYAIVVDRHGGSIRCEDAEGGGACFVVQLPLEEAHA